MHQKDKGVYQEITSKISDVQSKSEVFAIWEEIFDDKTYLTPFFRKELKNILATKTLQKLGIPINEIINEFI
jgi:hypothetical protein